MCLLYTPSQLWDELCLSLYLNVQLQLLPGWLEAPELIKQLSKSRRYPTIVTLSCYHVFKESSNVCKQLHVSPCGVHVYFHFTGKHTITRQKGSVQWLPVLVFHKQKRHSSNMISLISLRGQFLYYSSPLIKLYQILLARILLMSFISAQ